MEFVFPTDTRELHVLIRKDYLEKLVKSWYGVKSRELEDFIRGLGCTLDPENPNYYSCVIYKREGDVGKVNTPIYIIYAKYINDLKKLAGIK